MSPRGSPTCGEEQERANRSLVAALGERLPELAAEHGAALTSLAEAATTAEQAWLETERLAATAAGAERIARTELLRALQRNEGALSELFPGDKRQAKSYFRKSARRRPGEPASSAESRGAGRAQSVVRRQKSTGRQSRPVNSVAHESGVDDVVAVHVSVVPNG